MDYFICKYKFYNYLRKFKNFCFLFIIFLTSKALAYLIPESEIREIETIDHEVCLSKGLEITDNYSRKMYWLCRLNLINERIKKIDKGNGKNKFYITELKRIRNVIENYMQKIQNDLDYGNKENKEYSKITLRKKDAYYYNLLHFEDIDYSTTQVNTESEIKEIIEVRNIITKKKEKNKLRSDLKKFPECIVYDVGSKEFNKCLEIKNNIEQCKLMAEDKIRKKNIEDRFYCKEKSIEKYPDHLALYNSEYEELRNMKRDEFVIDRKKDETIRRRLLELNNLMSGPRLSATQLIDLRKYEEEKCLMDKQLENSMSKVLLIGECENIILSNKKIDSK